MRHTAIAAIFWLGTAVAQVADWDANSFRGGPLNRSSYSGMPLSGSITGGSSRDFSQLRVQLIDGMTKMPVAESMVASNGTFSMGTVPTGNFEVRVLGLMGSVLYSREFHTGAPGHLTIPITAERVGPVAPISMRRLQHQVPKEARKLVDKATSLYRKAKDQEANETKAGQMLEKAIGIDPECFEALSSLGALELERNEPELALTHLLKAHEIDPSTGLVEVNLAAAYILLKRYPEAETAARQALKGGVSLGRARYLLALSLLRQDKGHKEAVEQLEVAKQDFPAAEKLLKRLVATP